MTTPKCARRSVTVLGSVAMSACYESGSDLTSEGCALRLDDLRTPLHAQAELTEEWRGKRREVPA